MSGSSTVINTNVMALNTYRNLTNVSTNQERANQRLSSGKKINSAADDAAGLAISEKMRAQIKGLDMASKNAEDAISLIQTAEGSLSEIDSMTQRIRELAVQAANDTNTSTEAENAAAGSDREKIAKEILQLQDEITKMAGRTEFNTKVLATGAYASGQSFLNFQIGANADNGGTQSIDLHIGSVSATGLGLSGDAAFSDNAAISAASVGSIGSLVSVGSFTQITQSLTIIDRALEKVSTERANLGAKQNRLEYTNNNLKVSSENLSSAKSRIEDADMAKEMMNLTSANVLQQAAISMLSQANQRPQSVLQLLG